MLSPWVVSTGLLNFTSIPSIPVTSTYPIVNNAIPEGLASSLRYHAKSYEQILNLRNSHNAYLKRTDLLTIAKQTNPELPSSQAVLNPCGQFLQVHSKEEVKTPKCGLCHTPSYLRRSLYIHLLRPL